MVGLRRIAGRRADAAVFLGDQLVAAERLVAGVAPEFPAHALMQPLGEGFGQTVGQRLDQNGGIIVVGALEALGDVVLADAGGDGEGADVIVEPAVARRDEIAERLVEAALALHYVLLRFPSAAASSLSVGFTKSSSASNAFGLVNAVAKTAQQTPPLSVA